MRDIKFRAWTGERMIPHEYCDVLLKNVNNTGRYSNNFIYTQFTGLKDKNGKDIYEGDILQVTEDDGWSEDIKKNYAVEWGDSSYPAFTLKGYEDLEYNSLQHAVDVVSCEVIGNIYESPQLLTTEPNAAVSDTTGDDSSNAAD